MDKYERWVPNTKYILYLVLAFGLGHKDWNGTDRFCLKIRLIFLVYPNTCVESQISMIKIELGY